MIIGLNDKKILEEPNELEKEKKEEESSREDHQYEPPVEYVMGQQSKTNDDNDNEQNKPPTVTITAQSESIKPTVTVAETDEKQGDCHTTHTVALNYFFSLMFFLFLLNKTNTS